MLKIVEIFTNVFSSKTKRSGKDAKDQNSGAGQYHINLLARLTSPNYLATLLNLLVLASPQVKFMILKIIQQLVRVEQISPKIFDQAVE